MRFVRTFLWSFAVFALMAFSANSASAQQTKPNNAHWSYHGATEPGQWGKLSPDYSACAKGMHQSPINIPVGALLDPMTIEFRYKPSAVNILNNGHTVQLNYDKGSYIVVGGKQYDLVQFHFHAQSEHTVNSVHSPMELHLVHKSAKGELAVIGVLLVTGKENPAYEAVLSHLPQTEGDVQTISGIMVNANDLLPGNRAHWRYDGSLTTPPCTEGVKWLVMKTAVELSKAQIKEFTSNFADNFRPVQDLHGRAFSQ